jgi:hypothetical protein
MLEHLTIKLYRNKEKMKERERERDGREGEGERPPCYKQLLWKLRILQIIILFGIFYIHMSVYCNMIPNYNQQDATFFYLLIFTDALHVSGSSSTNHQEHITVHTVVCFCVLSLPQ